MASRPGTIRLLGSLTTAFAHRAPLAVAILFNAVALAPEVRIGSLALNDLVFHRAAAERLAASLAGGEPFLDPWVSEWALGYPVWKSYQPLPHLLGALALWVSRPWAEPATAFSALFYVLVVTLPISVYAGARLLGLSRPAAGLAALLSLAPASTGDAERYGLGYGSMVWRGAGLYTQVAALHLLALTLGLVARVLDGHQRPWRGSVPLALTALSHIVFGYVAFVSTAPLAFVGPRGGRSQRLARGATLVAGALLLLAWFVVPLVVGRSIVHRSRWEDPRKWDSHGARYVLGELASGRLFDGDRIPVLTVLAAIGLAGALCATANPTARRLLALGALWLALYFGRETWGHLLLLVGVPPELHLHRLAAAVQLCAVLIAAFGIDRLVARASACNQRIGAAAAVALGLSIAGIGMERWRYLDQSAAWGAQNLAAYAVERADLDAALRDTRELIARTPGRVSAGLAHTWGGSFRVGWTPVHAFLAREHLDQVSFLYHAMSKASDLMVARDENDPEHDGLFGVRAVVAPVDRPMPEHLRLRSVHGRFAVYESSPDGYFGLADVGAHYAGPPEASYDVSAAWLKSSLLRSGVVISLDPAVRPGPAVDRWQPLPPVSAGAWSPRGRIVGESKSGETYHATVELDRPAYVLAKLTWNPDLQARVDGDPARLVHVTPGFAAVAVPSGRHEIEVRYAPGPLKPVLMVLGIAVFLVGTRSSIRMRTASAESRLAERLAVLGGGLAQPRLAASAALVLFSVLALHALFRGKLVSGHDATSYPPRVAQMARVLSERHVPPIWAPDLSAGYGQPLFEFAPPLVYLASLVPRALGLGLADSIQVGLALLFLPGAAACYRIGRALGAGRSAAVGGALAWLFSPYVCLDLFVRAAFAEAAAVAVLPLALLGLIKVVQKPGAGPVLLASGAVALVPLAHNAIALLALPALAVVILVGARNGRSLLSAGLAMAGGLALSAYFWLPALLEKGLVHTERLRGGDLLWSDHLVAPRQLLWSAWGYGKSGPGAGDGMSFGLGLVHLLLGVAGFLIARRSPYRLVRGLGAAFGAAALGGALLSTSWAAPVWSRVEVLQYLVYPWRALVLPGLFLPLLGVFAFERAGPRLGWALSVLLLLTNAAHTEPERFLTFDDEFYAPASIASRGLNTTTREEYEPRWVKERPAHEPRGLVGLDAPVEFATVSRRAARQEFLVSAPIATAVEASTFFYPGWRVAIDGESVPVEPAPVSGTMRFAVPAGEHRIVLALHPTPVRKASLALSLGAVLLWALVALAAGFRNLRSCLPTGSVLNHVFVPGVQEPPVASPQIQMSVMEGACGRIPPWRAS